MHKNVYNFFIIFQYFPTFYDQCKNLCSFWSAKMSNSNYRYISEYVYIWNDYVRQ